VSAAERPQFQNHFFGPQIVQVVIDDPGATDPDESTVGLQVKGVTVPRVHLQDGLWYHYFAEQAAFLIFLDVMTDGIRDNNIAVINHGVVAPDANNPAAIPGGYTQVFGSADTFVAELTVIGGVIFVELDQGDIFPTLPNAFCDPSVVGVPCPVANINPDLNIPGDAPEAIGAGGNDVALGGPFGAFATEENVDWPYIRLTGINELDIVAIRAGSASVNLTYDDFNESISSRIDRSAAYPLDAEVIVSYTDFMWNINPVEEDVVIFAFDKSTGTPEAVFYNLIRNHDPDATGAVAPGASGRNIPNLLPVLFRPSLNFDTRQVLELDLEGVQTLQFNEFVDLGVNLLLDQSTSFPPGDDTFGNFGLPRNAGNAFLIDTSPAAAAIDIAAFLGNLPAIQMIESDPNTSVFESIDKQQGSVSDIFTGVNDRVANFDYFDIINSAAMTLHDGFATVDREVYDSADRAVFTVTDPDQNLRSRVSEQPSAVRSNSFVKVGSPFPLGNNPTFATFFGKNTLPTNGLGAGDVNQFDFEQGGAPFDVYGADGLLGTGDDVAGEREGIEQALFSLAFDADDVADGLVDGVAGALALPAVIKAAAELELNTGTGGGALVSVRTAVGPGTTPGYPDIPAALVPVGGAAIRIDVPPAGADIVVFDLNNNGVIQTGAVPPALPIDSGEAVFLAGSGDIAETNSLRSQRIGLDFNTGLIPPIGGDRPSGIIINSAVNLADLAKFTEFRATGTQIMSNGVLAPTPPGQAFPIDPAVARTSVWTTTLTGIPAAGSTGTHGSANVAGLTPGLVGATPYRVLYPQYNLLNVNLAELATAAELITNDNFNAVAVQLKVDDGQPVALRDVVTRLVDFTLNELVDVDATGGSGPFNVGLLGTTKIGIGSFRIVDFLAVDWDDDGLFWPNDTNEPFANLNVQVSVVFVDTNANVDPIRNEPAEVIVPGNHVGAIDLSGLSIVVPPPVVPGSTASFPAQRTIDEVTLLANENFVYRIQVKEQGSNSSIFTGRMDFITANQFDTTQRALADIVASGDPAKALLPNRFIPPNRLAFGYTDLDIVAVFRPTSASFIYETRDGKIEWDRSSYSFGQDGFLTLTDEDLNRRPDATERYDLPIAGFVFFELGKQRVVDNALPGGNFILQIDATFLETGPNTGTFVAQVTMPFNIVVSTAAGADQIQGTVDDTVSPAPGVAVQQQDLEANYVDVRDRSSIRQEFDTLANIRTTLGDVVLDRAAYPAGAIMYVEIHDNDFNTDVDIRETIDLRQFVITDDTPATSGWGVRTEGDRIPFNLVPAACDTAAEFVTPACASANPIVEINIFRTGVGRLVTLLPTEMLGLPADGSAGIVAVAALNDRFGIGIVTTPGTFAILPILDRNGSPVREATETGPNTGIFEFEAQMPGPAEEDRFPFRLPDVLTAGTLLNPQIRSNQPIQVTYTDPSDESGEADTEEELATFLTNTARLRTDRLEYGLGDRVEMIIEEPDFNRDSRAVDQVSFRVLDIVTDKVDTEFGAGAADRDFGDVVRETPNLRMNLTNFRETGFNSGVFVVAMEELVRELVDRGESVRLLYFDRTPSGGGSEIRVQYSFLVVAILPEIVFDKEEYTPFDEVIVSIISPDSNNDPDRIETIRPLISSSSESLGRRSFPETGPSTGIFEEDFDLTPDKTRFPGDLRAIREDGVTVEFRIDSDTVATKSVFVNYHVGQVMFDKDAFRMNERGVLRVIDPDANTNPNTIDTTQVRFWSTTDRGGLLVTLRETGDRTGIFEEIITFTPDEESSGTRLRVTEGDTITAKYTDNTLPAPAALDNAGVFTVEVEELFASALIGATVPPLERAVASQPVLVDQTGATITDVSTGTQVLIQSTITNSQTKKQPFAYIVQIKDGTGVTISLSWVTGELPAKDSLAAAQSWIPARSGTYTIEVFVWESVDTPTALSPVRTTTVTVR
ncbi:MAG: hypothetical protein QXW73_02580, partial [Nitrososphaerales archaeon]